MRGASCRVRRARRTHEHPAPHAVPGGGYLTIKSHDRRRDSYLAGIPYHLGSRDERGFETTFFLIFDLLGIQIDTEFKTATGRVDAVVCTKTSIFVMEFKYNKTARAALAQIDEKGYLLPFKRDGRKLCKVGINFSDKLQTVDEWVVEWA